MRNQFCLKTSKINHERLIDLFLSIAIRIKYARYWDSDLSVADKRYRWKISFFNDSWIYDDRVCPTITAHDSNLVWWENRFLNNSELILAWSFPQDYNFWNVQPTYLIWMSVPPLMMYKLSNEIKKQRLDLIYKASKWAE